MQIPISLFVERYQCDLYETARFIQACYDGDLNNEGGCGFTVIGGMVQTNEKIIATNPIVPPASTHVIWCPKRIEKIFEKLPEHS